ncbi:Rrf2 family transcriptional regulator [Candidatus Collierbacteria bacterium]|nr:Rrf2 family transcriptional regulator [Candidatus Collierbacteria bacterium]
MALFHITRKADLGLSLLSMLAKNKSGRLSLTQMEKMGMPKSFMGRIANDLVSAGILNSREGRGGGYRLNYPAKEIQVMDVLFAIEGEVLPVQCLKKPGSCNLERDCQQRGFMHNFANKVGEMLSSYTLADLIKF